jgi:hypothetical protein
MKLNIISPLVRFISDDIDITKEEVHGLVTRAMYGELDFLKVKYKGEVVYIPSGVLANSIITVIERPLGE